MSSAVAAMARENVECGGTLWFVVGYSAFRDGLVRQSAPA